MRSVSISPPRSKKAAPLAGLLQQLITQEITFLRDGHAIAADDGLRRLHGEQFHQLAAKRLDIQDIVFDRAPCRQAGCPHAHRQT